MGIAVLPFLPVHACRPSGDGVDPDPDLDAGYVGDAEDAEDAGDAGDAGDGDAGAVRPKVESEVGAL